MLLALSLLTQSIDYGSTMVGKYQKLLYVLPLALFFLADIRLINMFVRGFMWANGVILVISLAGATGYLSGWDIDPTNPVVFKLHITQNFFMALATLLWLAKASDASGWKRLGYSALVVLASVNILMVVQGRTGYVVLITGMGIWLWLTLSYWQRFFVLAFGIAVVMALILIPNRAMERMVIGVNEIQRCVQAPAVERYEDCDSSMGLRTAFMREAFSQIAQSPFFGCGAGSFWYHNPETGYSVHNPHNEYLLTLVQSGILGLLLFLSWMFCCFRAAGRQTVARRNLIYAVLGCYMAGHLFNSFLLDSSEGHLFVVIAAILSSLAVYEGDTQNSPT